MKIEMTGKVSTRLTVIESAGRNRNGSAMWLCECECGNRCAVSGRDLRAGKTRSCGCLHRESMRERMAKIQARGVRAASAARSGAARTGKAAALHPNSCRRNARRNEAISPITAAEINRVRAYFNAPSVSATEPYRHETAVFKR